MTLDSVPQVNEPSVLNVSIRLTALIRQSNMRCVKERNTLEVSRA